MKQGIEHDDTIKKALLFFDTGASENYGHAHSL